MSIIRKVLTEIQESKSFERLEEFKPVSVWKDFSHEDRILLAQLLVMHGAQQLSKGDHLVLENFETASHISSHSPEIYYQQGAILSGQRENIRCLTLAAKTLEKAIQQDPSFFKGWYLRALVLKDIGLFEGEAAYFEEANQIFEKASHLLEEKSREEFYWQWGYCLAYLGKVSGEPLDFHKGIEKFRIAYGLGYQNAKFFIDFGQCFYDLALLLEKVDYLTEALKLFNQAVRQDPTLFEGWFNQACCIQKWVELTYNDKLAEQGERSFMKASEINPQCSQLWLKWGEFETTIGKAKRLTHKLEESLIKFAKAYQLEPGHGTILRSWAATELFLGAQEERLDYIQSAQKKIVNSLEIQSEEVDTWYLYGSCFIELGRYFSDPDFYNQAIEKFHYGLNLSPRHSLLWYGMALANFALGEMTDDVSLIEKAVKNFSQCNEECFFSQFWNDWGVALIKLADMKQETSYVETAIEKFEKALKSRFHNIEEEDIDLEWVYNYGCAYDLLGDLTEEACHFEKAIQVLTQVLEIYPEYQQAQYNLALAMSHLAELVFDVDLYHKAIELFQSLLAQNPEDDIIYLDFGITLINLALLIHDDHHLDRSQSLYRQAESHLLQAAALGNTQAFYQLTGLYSIQGQYHFAMYYLERAQMFGTLPGIEDLLHDEWLEGLRQLPTFRQFISDLSSQQSSDDK